MCRESTLWLYYVKKSYFNKINVKSITVSKNFWKTVKPPFSHKNRYKQTITKRDKLIVNNSSLLKINYIKVFKNGSTLPTQLTQPKRKNIIFLPKKYRIFTLKKFMLKEKISYTLFCTQIVFVFHRLKAFYIFWNHIVFFFFFRKVLIPFMSLLL